MVMSCTAQISASLPGITMCFLPRCNQEHTRMEDPKRTPLCCCCTTLCRGDTLLGGFLNRVGLWQLNFCLSYPRFLSFDHVLHYCICIRATVIVFVILHFCMLVSWLFWFSCQYLPSDWL